MYKKKIRLGRKRNKRICWGKGGGDKWRYFVLVSSSEVVEQDAPKTLFEMSRGCLSAFFIFALSSPLRGVLTSFSFRVDATVNRQCRP